MEKRNYEVRASEKPLIIEGLAVVFDQPAKIGEITEVIRRGALDGAVLSDVCLFTNHNDRAIPLARSPKTLTLEVTDAGLEVRATLPDTEQGKALYSAVQRGDLSQMSFAFDIAEQDTDKEKQERAITKISRIYEISIVNRAAYPQTTVQARAGKEETNMNVFNPITSAVFDTAQTAPAGGDALEYRSAFYKTLLGHELTEAETRAYNAARAQKREDAFNTLSNSAAVIPETTLNEVIKGIHPMGGLYNEIRKFAVPANLSVPVGTPADPAQWHVEGAPVDRDKLETHNVSFSAYELVKVLSLSAAAKRMTLAAFEAYLIDELRQSIVTALGEAIVNGTGAGQPQGLLTGITWDEGNSLSTPAAQIIQGILKTIAKLSPRYTNNAKFALSNATLFSSVYPAQTADGALILMPDVQNGVVRRLFGFEIVTDDFLPLNTIIFGNFRYYGANIPSGVAVEMSRDSGFRNALIDYRALCIADAKPIVPEAFVKLTVTGAAK
jgi:HK97 family phage major capsid protein